MPLQLSALFARNFENIQFAAEVQNDDHNQHCEG
jgi:hypothetical protein